MAFRRRPQGRFPRRRQPVSWARSVFTESAIDLTGVLTEFVLFDRTDVSATAETLSTTYHVLRVICNGFIGWTPLTTTQGFDIGGFAWAIYTSDNEDSDNSLLTTATGSIMQSLRIIDAGFVGGNFMETPAAQIGEVFIPGLRIDVDRKLRVNVRQDELLLLGIQANSPLNTNVSVASLNMFGSVLIKTP